VGGVAALIGATLTRWADSSRLHAAEHRVATYQEEVQHLNDQRAELLASLEERGDDLRRVKAELARRGESREPEPTTWAGGPPRR
jgi:hypothetical protein